jgi:endonuclease-3
MQLSHGQPESWAEIYRLLAADLGEPDLLHESSPLSRCQTALEILIATILTQATSDRNALKAWSNFQAKYAGFEEVMYAGPEALAETIRPAGMAAQRSRVILDVLREINRCFGRFSLEGLADNPEAAWNFLNNLPGVGPKTAACTMLFGFKLPWFPVDVHIERIAKRRGWVDSKSTPGEIQQQLALGIPRDLLGGMHILLLNLGRKYCRPQKPECSRCPVRVGCVFNS